MKNAYWFCADCGMEGPEGGRLNAPTIWREHAELSPQCESDHLTLFSFQLICLRICGEKYRGGEGLLLRERL